MDFLKNKIQNNLNLTVLLLLVVIYAVTYSCYSIVFDSGDDIVFQKIASGYFTGTPDVHLVFINVIIGYLLKPLYLFNNTVYWYSFLMLGLQALSLGAILKIELRKHYSVLYYVALLLLFQYVIIRLQFTTVSALLTIAGFMLLTQRLEHKKQDILAPLAFLYLGFLIRDQMFLLIIVFLATFVLIQKGKQSFEYFRNKAYLVQFSIFGLILISSSLLDDYHYSSKEWSHYADYNAVRGRINDSPMFRSFYENRFSNDRLEKSNLDIITKNFIALKGYDKDKLGEMLKMSKDDANSSVYRWNSLKSNALQKNNFLLYIFMLFIVVYVVREKKFSLLIPLALLVVLFVAISLEMTFKNRLSFPILLIFFIYYASMVSSDWYRYLTVCFALLLLFTNKTFFTGLSGAKKIEIASLPTDRPIIPLNSALTTFHPFKLNEVNNMKNIVNMGWLANSPLIIKMLKEHSVAVTQHYSVFDDEKINSSLYYHINNEASLELYNSNLQLKGMKLVPLNNYKNVYTIQKL
ncbi:hypothetical protein [Flavobacterium sp.]